MADVRTVLERCDPSLLDPCGESEQLDLADADGTLFLTDSWRVQKVLWRQLFVLDSMMSLLEGLESAQHLLTWSCPPQPEGGARGRWKALKLENRKKVEEMEVQLRSLQDRIEQIHSRRHTITQLLQQLHSKRQQSDQLEESLQKAQVALQACDCQLTKLRAEAESISSQLVRWQCARDGLQTYLSAVQQVTQIVPVSFDQSQLCLELKHRPPGYENQGSNDLESLKLSVIWSHDDHFRLQVNEGAGLLLESTSGCRSALSTALLEVLQCYVGQAELLSEINALRSRFAIDWRPAQRLLVYLKSASLECHLEVDEGYPRRGRVRLLSVHRGGQPVETSGMQPPKTDSCLTDWLVFLCSSPFI